MSDRKIAPDNAWRFRCKLEDVDDYDVYVALTGQIVSAFLSTASGGDPIDGTEVTLTEAPNRDGRYRGVIDAPSVNGAIAGRATIWERFVITDDFALERRLVVSASRRQA